MVSVLNCFKNVDKVSKFKLIQRFIISALVISIAWTFGTSIEVKAEALDTDVVTFEDVNLEAAVRSKLVKPSGDITVGDMKSMTGILNAYGKNISSLKGIEYAVNITQLMLYNNKISDLTSLENINNLQYLFLSNNQISDITPLKNMSSLEYLYLTSNEIHDITPLKNLINLIFLRLDYNQINDISPLIDMKSLVYIGLNNNKIENISPLKDIPTLTKIYLYENQIKDISPIKEMPWVTSINLNDNLIETLPTWFGDLSGLTFLNLSRNKMKGNIPSELGKLTNLSELSLDGNYLTGDIPIELNNLTKLTTDAEWNSFANNQLSGVIPVGLKSKVGVDAFKGNLFEGESNQKQLVLKRPSTDLNLSLGEVPNQNALQSLVELTDGANKSNPLYELELVPIDNTFIDPVTNKTLKSGTTTSYVKIKGVSNTNSYAKTLFPITINIGDKLGSNKEINVSFSLQESLEITMDNNAINFGQVSSNGGEKQSTDVKVTSSLPYTMSFMGLNNFIGANDNSHVIPIEKLSLKLDALEPKALSLSKVNYISNGVAGIDKNHALEFFMGNTLGYVSDTYSTQVQIVVENL